MVAMVVGGRICWFYCIEKFSRLCAWPVGAITPNNLSHVDSPPPNGAQEALRLLVPSKSAYLGKVRPTGNESQGRPFLFTHPRPNRPAEGGYEVLRYYVRRGYFC